MQQKLKKHKHIDDIRLAVQVTMRDPVIAADGHTCERAAMQAWLQHHHTSPVTGVSLAHSRLVSNVIVKAAIANQQD